MTTPIEPNTVQGDDGDNEILLGNGADLARAGLGNDTIEAGGGNDNVYAEGGDDHIQGGTGRDKLDGGEGNDYIDGGAGADRIYGGTGDDTLRGGQGDDVLYGDIRGDRDGGATGADTFQFDMDDGRDKIYDFVSGIDTIELLDGGTIDDLTFTYTGGGNTIVTYGDTTMVFYDSTVTADDMIGLDPVPEIVDVAEIYVVD